MPLKFLHFYIVVSCIGFLSVQTLKYFNVFNPPWVLNYLNDFLMIPMVAILGLHAVWLLKKDHTDIGIRY